MKLDDVFNNYPPSFIQDFLTVLKAMEQEGIGMAEIIEKTTAFFHESILAAAEFSKERIRAVTEYNFHAKRCSACGSIMQPNRVNDHPSTMVGGNFKSCWVCTDMMGCGEVEYSELTVREEIEKHGLSEFYPSTVTPVDPNRRRAAYHAARVRSARPRQFRLKNVTQGSSPAGNKPRCGGK